MIYFIEAVGSDWIKIGSSDDPCARIIDLQVACPLKLNLLLACDGDRRDEKRLHSILRHHRGIGEWFNRGAAIAAMRIVRRFGVPCLSDLERLDDNRRREAHRRAGEVDRLRAHCERRLARHVLRTIPCEQSKRVTLNTHRAWRKTLSGETRLKGHPLIHSLAYAPKYVGWMIKVQTGLAMARRPVIARYQGIIAEADRFKGVGQ